MACRLEFSLVLPLGRQHSTCICRMGAQDAQSTIDDSSLVMSVLLGREEERSRSAVVRLLGDSLDQI